LIVQARKLLYERGQKGLDLARKIIIEENIPSEPLQEAVHYFINSWEDIMHPAFLSISCEAAGGKPQLTTNFAASLVLLAGAADLHDDIIDQSTVKYSKATVFGKFGKDLTILAGEILLFKGLYTLHEACNILTAKQKQTILELTKKAFLGITSAEAKEISLHGRTESAEEYFEMIKMKSAVSEATMRIGATLGNGSTEAIEVLGHCGKTLGILATSRDEFIDMFEAEELKNRMEKECLPLPILVTFRDLEKKNAILKLLRQPLNEEIMEKLIDLTMDSWETRNLTEKLKALMNEELQRIATIKICQAELNLLLRASIENL